MGWGTATRTLERLRRLAERAPDPEAERRERERVRRKEALERLQALPDWHVVEEIFARHWDQAFQNVVISKIDPPEVLQVLLDLYETFAFTVWAGEHALKRLAARRMAVHQRMTDMRETPEGGIPQEMRHG